MRDKISNHLVALGLSPLDGTAITTQCDAVIDSVTAVEAAKATAKNVVATKDNQKKTSLPLTRNLMKRGKTAATYTQAIGEDLQIIGDEDGGDISTFKPELKAALFPGYVRLSFTKKMVDGVNIYWRLKGQATWQLMARDTVSPYDDTRLLATPGQAETREYLAIGVLEDAEVGQASDIVSVVFGG